MKDGDVVKVTCRYLCIFGGKRQCAEYVEEPLKYIQCSEICTLINEKFHTET